jgi:hypothetical protein
MACSTDGRPFGRVSDWPSAKARIKEGPPFAKGGVFG